MSKQKLKQVPVYLPEEKYDKVVEKATQERQPLTRWIENAIDFKLKKRK